MRPTHLAVALLLLPALSALASDPASDPAPRDRLPIVDRAIEHHGGELYRSTATRFELCSLSGCYDVAVRIDGERYEYLVEGEAGAVRRKVRATNDAVEVWENGERLAVAPEERQRYRDWAMARVYFPFLPFRLNDPGVRQHDRGMVSWNGRELHEVKVTFRPGSSTHADDEYMYWFDPATGRLEQFAYSFAGDPGGLRFRRLTDYRRVGGILFADQVNLGIEGPGLEVGMVTPELVTERMRKVSEVELRSIDVRPLP